MWCIPKITPTFIDRMDDITDLYSKPYDPKEPVVGIDEKTIQILDHLVDPLPLSPGHGIRVDFHYKRNGTVNAFMCVEPKGGTRLVKITNKKERVDYLAFLWDVYQKYINATCIHAVVDNFSTHSIKEIKKVHHLFPFLKKFKFHLTPVHASWLNVAELEIGVYDRQCVKKKRLSKEELLRISTDAWQGNRNARGIKIIWKFTKQKAREKFKIGSGDQINGSIH
jgi:hypothetical protein